MDEQSYRIRQLKALESIAGSLERISFPVKTVIGAHSKDSVVMAQVKERHPALYESLHRHYQPPVGTMVGVEESPSTPVTTFKLDGQAYRFPLGDMLSPLVSAEEARHVLAVYDGDDGNIVSGGFITKLLESMAHADSQNMDKLARGFPGYVAAVRLFKFDNDGVEKLRRIAAVSR